MGCELYYVYASGDAAVGELIDAGIMKQWLDDGVPYASYKTQKVGTEEGTASKVQLQPEKHSSTAALRNQVVLSSLVRRATDNIKIGLI